ncbi:hypothetical protein OUZ56_017273 [Daphnia magna]|uniref:Uncharacterized protein n=1 Tax=Daphnia magna TaxID=35525 RepID=A0ABR0ASJ9_9CRUS|nr:hypothetical protein OUZ56_017273 [Daphnia magna]
MLTLHLLSLPLQRKKRIRAAISCSDEEEDSESSSHMGSVELAPSSSSDNYIPQDKRQRVAAIDLMIEFD